MMTHRFFLAGTLAFALCAHATPILAQQGLWLGPNLPMSPQFERGQPVSPFFEGWYENADGSYTLSFGYFNRNTEERLEIPLGPDNFIQPAQYDGVQPTSFPTHADYSIKGREWGAFAVVVPPDFVGPGKDVVWTIRSKGATHSVPGRVGNAAYQLKELDQPMGQGSLAPRLRFHAEGSGSVGPLGIVADPLTTRVGVPLTVTAWAADNAAPGTRPLGPVTLTWFKYQSPISGEVSFAPERIRIDGMDGEASTVATFTSPGEYLLRVRADNWTVGDSDGQRLCCWTNGYVKVTVTP